MLWNLCCRGGGETWELEVKRKAHFIPHLIETACMSLDHREGGGLQVTDEWEQCVNILGSGTPPSNCPPHQSGMCFSCFNMTACDHACIRSPPPSPSISRWAHGLWHQTRVCRRLHSWTRETEAKGKLCATGQSKWQSLKREIHCRSIRRHAGRSKSSQIPPGAAEDQPRSNHPQEWVVSLAEVLNRSTYLLGCFMLSCVSLFGL